MKIAMLGHKRIPSREGGVEIVVEELSTRMAKKGNEVTCYNRSGKHVSKKEKINNLNEYKGVKLVKTLTIDKKGLAAMTSSFFATIKALFSKAKVVHYHAEGPCAMMWIIKWFSNKKVVATIHGLDWQRAKWGGFATKYIKFGEKMAVKYADEIIVLSKNVQKYFKDEYNRETNFIPNGVNKPEILKANIINKKYKLKKDDYILFLGRIVPEKGIHYLIDAYNNVKTNKKLVIAGGSSDTDEYYKELKEKAKNNKNIIFTGFVEGKELSELYSNAYIYCLPSDLEGMPLSLLEAMSYGNCCLTSNIEECSEVLEDKGVTFKKSNTTDLTKVLQKLCDDEKIVNDYKKDSQEYILKKYNWDDVTDKTLKLYEKKGINNNKIFFFGSVLYVIIYLVLLRKYNMGSVISRLRYYILAILILFGLIIIFTKRDKNNLKQKKLLLSIVTATVFFIFSIYYSVLAKHFLNFRTIVQISLFVMPCLFAFNIINIFDNKKIISFFKIVLALTIIIYFTENGHHLSDFFILNNWKGISFIKSTSFTESHLCSEIFLQLFLTFAYYKNNCNKNEFYSINIAYYISFLFTLLSFKRLAILFSAFIFIFNSLLCNSKKILIKKYNLIPVSFSILFTILTVVYYYFITGKLNLGIDVFNFTSGRNYILSLWENSNYLTYGYGSSLLVIGRYLEMDLIQIYLELNIFCLFIFCYNFFTLCNKNIYAYVIMCYVFLNLLTASSLPFSLGWIILLINISMINEVELKNNGEV